jgi:ADP-heptose:LPS heptosyltransferase
MLCAVPALRSLRAGLPETHVALVGLPWAREMVDRFPRYLDELVPFPGFPGIPEVPPAVEALAPFLAEVQARHFDLALQMHGNGSVTNPFTVLLGASENAGSYLPGAYRPSRAFIPYPDGLHELRRLTSLTRFLGMPDTGEDLEWPVTAEDRAALALSTGDVLGGAYAIVHAGASHGSRRWPAERFARAADRLAAEGLQVVLTGVRGDEPVVSAVASAMRARPLDLVGRTTLGALGALMDAARLVLCNDTGVSHIAAALRVPSVVVFSGSDPARWAPLDRELHLAVQGSTSNIVRAVEHQLGRRDERVA